MMWRISRGASPCSPRDVLLLSTGVIGRRIKMDAMLDAIPQLPATLGSAGAEPAHTHVCAR